MRQRGFGLITGDCLTYFQPSCIIRKKVMEFTVTAIRLITPVIEGILSAGEQSMKKNSRGG